MTPAAVGARCAVCGAAATRSVSPRRSTITRGPDPEDTSFSLTGVLPDVDLCEDDHGPATGKEAVVGWCDEEGCRRWGPVGGDSPCGRPYVAV